MDPTRSHAQRRRSGSKCASSLSIAFDRVRAFKQANYVPWIRMNRPLASQCWGLREPKLGLHGGFASRITTSNNVLLRRHTAPLAREPECPFSPGTLPESLSKGGQPVRNSSAIPTSLLEFVETVCFFHIASQKGLVFAPLISSINS